jgi:hypothetical protein
MPEMTPGVAYTASGDSLEDYPGWYVFRRGTDGRLYYYNVDYEITQWEHPRDKPHTEASIKSYKEEMAATPTSKVKARAPTPATFKEKLAKGFLWIVGGAFCFVAVGGASVVGRASAYVTGGHRVTKLKPLPKGGVLTEQ